MATPTQLRTFVHCGGGYSLIANSEESAENGETATQNNPYTTEYYDDGAKAPAVTSISIPASVEAIDPAFFQLFPNASRIEVAADSAHFTSYNGMLFGADESADALSLLLVPEGKEGIAVLPETTATVPACVFSRCIKLSAVTAAQAEGSTGASAFTTQDGILYTADKTTLLAAPAGLGASAHIAPECTHIAEGAFWGNTALKTIVAGSAVESIVVNPLFDPAAEAGQQPNADGDSPNAPVPAFNPDTTATATVALATDASRAAWEAAGFASFDAPAQPGDTTQADGFEFTLLPDYTLRVRWAGESAAPADLSIPATGRVNDVEYSVSTIAQDAFKGQAAIRALTVPEGISAIGASAFEACASLASAQLPGSLTSVGDAAFKGCAALDQVEIGGGLRSIGAAAFEGTAAPAFWLPASLATIGARAFAANSNLQRIVALGDVAAVDATALADCANVEIYLPYRQDGAYAWSAGVPITGNHVMPYGVALSADALILHQDESSDLLEGGYLESAGSVDAQFAYDAAPISVDPSTGTVTAKQTGKTTVAVNLTLDDKVIASAMRPVVVAMAPQPVEDPDKIVEDDGHDHEGEEGCTEGIDAPEISYYDQLFEEGDYYTSGNLAYEEKVINRTVALSSSSAEDGIAPLSLDFETSTVASYSGTHSTTGGSKAKMEYDYNQYTRTLTITMDGQSWRTTSACGGSVACATEGHAYAWRKSRNKLNAIRKLVLVNFDQKYPRHLFSKMGNLEEIEIQGSFLTSTYNGNTSGVTSVESLFEDCPQLRVIPSNMTLPSTVTTTTDLFSFSTYKIDGTNTSWERLTNTNQLAAPSGASYTTLLTAYTGSNTAVRNAVSAANRYISSSAVYYISARALVTTYHTVTFDNQGGMFGHQTAGESSAASTKTYTIKVPTGSPVPELAGTPTYSVSGVGSWTFGGYVDALNNAPKEYVGPAGYPNVPREASDATYKVTSNITLKAFWYNNASFSVNGGSFSGTYAGNSWSVVLPKGYSINAVSSISLSGMSLMSVFALGDVTNSSGLATGSPATSAPSVTHPNGRGFRGYGITSGDKNFRDTAYYDANRNCTSAVYNSPYNFYAMWGYYTVNFYTNVDISWYTKKMHWVTWNGTEYGTRDTGTSTKSYAKCYTVTDVYGFNRWSGNFQIFNSSTVSTNNSAADDSAWFQNYRDTCWTTPTYHTLKEIRKDSATGEVLSAWSTSNSGMQVTLSGNMNVYLIFDDNTPTDTFTFKVNGGKWSDNTTADKTTTARRGSAITTPGTPTRTATAEYTYTFAGWNTSSTATTGSTALGNANGNKTYYAIWTATKIKYTITWKTGLSGAYWGTNTSDTADKTTSVEYGSTPTAPATPAKAATSNTKWTFKAWSPTISAVTGAKTYTATWKVEYLTTWKVGSTDAYWGTSKTDKADKTKWVESGTVPTQPATPNRDAIAQYTYTFSSWNPAPVAITAPQTYTAIWDQKVNSYSTTWNVSANGGCWNSNKSDTGNKTTGEKVYGTVLTGPDGASATRARYTFVGWSTNKDADPDDPSQYSKSISVVGATTYYAIFSANTYTINLMKNAGDEDDPYGPSVGSVTARYDHDWTIGAGNVPNRRGYYFIGWDTDPEYKGMTPKYPMVPDANGKYVDTTFSGNLIGESAPDSATLYAVWNESRYTIVFHENWDDDETGTGSVPARIDALYSQQVIIPTNDLARTGYNFANWNTAPDGSGTTYKTRGAYTHVGLSEVSDANVRGCTVHLYAQWDANQYIVQFDPNIVISDPEDKGEWHIEAGDEVKLVSYGTEVDVDTVFSRPGYEFIGWSFEKNVPADEDDTPIVDFAIQEDGTFDPATFKNLTTDKLGLVRLYAQWKGGSYTIEFDGNATDDRPVQVGPGGVMNALEMHYGVAKKLPANTFVCDGFTFKGWNTKADGTGEAYLDQALVQDVPGVSGGKVTLYAQWSPVLSLTSPIDACIEVYIDGMDMYVYEVRAGQTGKWPTDTPNGDGTKDDHEDQFEHGQAALESRTPAKLFIEQIDCIPNLDPEEGMARIFPVDGTPALDSWEDFELEFTALNENTGKRVKVATEFGNSYAFVAGANNNYFIPAYDSATNTPGTLDYTLLLRIPESKAKQPNTVRYSEGPVKIATLMFTCRVAD